jgi:cation diffusion facilitator CzcD-associated flavoprotein CzcO
MPVSDSVQDGAGEPTTTRPLDAVVVGAGFAGLYMLHRLRGLGLSALVLEAGSGIGGTWFWNRYPGARCDVESLAYSYSFSEDLEQEWPWTERYPSQAEILRYLDHVADRFALRPDIRLNTRVTSAVYDETDRRWQLHTDDGGLLSARYCVMATGCLSAPHLPTFSGTDSFAGRIFHTGRWPHGAVDFTGERVAVIGTGSSGIQIIPEIAKQAASLTVFQRTPNFSIPAWNRPLDPEVQQQTKAGYVEFRQRVRESYFGLEFPVTELSEKSPLDVSPEQRREQYAAWWAEGGIGFLGAFANLLFDKEANDTAAEFVRSKIRETVHDPDVARILMPVDHALGTKRPCVDTDYYATYNRDNVTLVDVKASPIEAITSRGIRTKDSTHDLDSIVFATGFDAMTGALLSIDIQGRSGISLRDKWAGGPMTYLGIATAGFPNLFIITGPGSPSVLGNVVVSIEQHVEWIGECITYLDEQGAKGIEPSPEAEAAWVSHVDEVANLTLYPAADSWYMGANVPGKPRVFMPYIGGIGTYRGKCEEVAAKGYEGFVIVG